MVGIKFKNGSYIETIPNNESYRSKRFEEQWRYWNNKRWKNIEL